MAGSRPGDTVFDPFSGAATTGLAALVNGRNYVGLDINRKYIDLSIDRLKRDKRLKNQEVLWAAE
jgi:DNA modification methylase